MTQSIDAVMPHVGDTLGGRYHLAERVGAGGMGRVFRARDTVLARDVAIKLFHTDRVDEPEPGRRLAEARVLAALDHPCLVTLYDARLDGDDQVYLVMEYVDGPSLQRRIEAGALDPGFVAALLADLAGGLAAVHAAGVIHRDVKPSNVLLRPVRDSRYGYEAVLADFGVAHLVDATRLTTPGTVVGTAAYLAPEQVRGEAPQPASDIYALGLLAIEALTRLHPYGGGTLQETVLARLSRPPVIPGTLGYEWKALLTAMTALDPTARPTATVVAARAEALIDRAPDELLEATAPDVATGVEAETAPWIAAVEENPAAFPPFAPLTVESPAASTRRRRRSASSRRRSAIGAWVGAAGAAVALIVGGHLLAVTLGSPAPPVTESTPSSPAGAPTPSPGQVAETGAETTDTAVDTASADIGGADDPVTTTVTDTVVAPSGDTAPIVETPTSDTPVGDAPRGQPETSQKNDPPRGPDENAAGPKSDDPPGQGAGRGNGNGNGNGRK